MLMALLWGHRLNLLHSTPRRSRPIPKALDTSASQRFGEATDQACDDANDIPHNSESRIIPRRPGTFDISGISGARMSELLEAA
jgi:hypothetical protein